MKISSLAAVEWGRIREELLGERFKLTHCSIRSILSFNDYEADTAVATHEEAGHCLTTIFGNAGDWNEHSADGIVLAYGLDGSSNGIEHCDSLRRRAVNGDAVNLNSRSISAHAADLSRYLKSDVLALRKKGAA